MKHIKEHGGLAVIIWMKTLANVADTIRLEGVFNRTPLSNVVAAGVSKEINL